jgi:hypothetical protein
VVKVGINYKLEWLPKTHEEVSELLDSIGPYLFADYDENQRNVHGDVSFDLSMWLNLWDMQSGFFIVARDGGKVVGLATAVRYRHLFHAGTRVDINRVAADTPVIVEGIVEYIKGIAGILGVDKIYLTRYTGNMEVKEQVYAVHHTT